MKKSFVLLFTLILITLFSLVAVNIFEVKSLSSINILKQHNYLQAKNYLKFLEEYLQHLDDLSSINSIEIPNENFNILAKIKRVNEHYEIELIVVNLASNIRLYKKIIK